MKIDNDSLFRQCRKVLKDNQRGSYTVPAEGLYPHQWLWDSCFIAIGLSHYDIERAQKELLSLTRGQWKNGMLPNMIFAGGWRYSAERYFWDSKRNLDAPKKIATSSITQPPMLAEAVVQIGKELSVASRQAWYEQMLPSLIDYHQWLYTERDPGKQGLTLQIHPWEVGLDNTPPWVTQLQENHNPWWLNAAKILPIDWLINRFRRDIKQTDKSHRISNLDALMYLDIIWRFRRRDYLIDEIIDHDKYLVQDLSYNCILIRANQHLETIAGSLKRSLPDNLQTSINNSRQALEMLWDEPSGEYYSRGFGNQMLIKSSTIACLMPLYSGSISHARAGQIVKKLQDEGAFNLNWPIPSVPYNSKWFDQDKYWQGPTWLNTNWLIIQGLKHYGFNKEARLISDKSLQLVAKHGAGEYFSPLTGQPLGARNFSWTAALAIDLLNS